MNLTKQQTKRLSVINYFIRACLIILTGLLFACSDSISSYTEVKHEPQIDPDYSGVTIPPNIAPLNFQICEKAGKYRVKIQLSDGDGIGITSSGKNVKIPLGKWKRFLEQCRGKDFFIDVFVKREGSWFKFKTIVNHVAPDPVDSYLVYRIIDPGFISWKKMGIYQRCLESFKETPIMINEMSENNCMNCHSFSKNDSRNMLFHMRGKYSGTIIYRNGEIKKVNTKTGQTISPGVYPAWHPDGRLIAFSVNQITQFFPAVPDKKVEVIDTLSDLILYDTETNAIRNCEAIASKERFETYPAWSPDGSYLYFCSAKAMPATRYKQIRYDLLRISFDPEKLQFGNVDTIVSSSRTGLSVAFPRISPDGKYLLFCMTAYGNFTIWHDDSDLYLMNLETGEITKPDINSNYSDSYHSWSSSGRWIVFSSRRSDGLFTRPYFAYFDTNGKTHKPFLLPQHNPEYYKTFLKSYNLPELITSAVKLNPRDFSEIVKSGSVNAYFKSIK